jgi:ubiquinone/menaquinone biosynthesis C-methylase UbiE
MTVDYETLAVRYDGGRDLSAEALLPWQSVLAPYLSGVGTAPVLDLGAGTGIHSRALSHWFQVTVVAVEPSEGMLRQAQLKSLDARIWFVRGQAEAIPMDHGTCSAAFLSAVLHHIDLEATAAELRRVLRSDAPLLLRQPFSDRTDGIAWLNYFPSAVEVTQRRWPTSQQVKRVFERHGFHYERLQTIRQETAPSFREYSRRISERVDSTLTFISDEEFTSGVRLMEEQSEQETGPVFDDLDLLVLRSSSHPPLLL